MRKACDGFIRVETIAGYSDPMEHSASEAAIPEIATLTVSLNANISPMPGRYLNKSDARSTSGIATMPPSRPIAKPSAPTAARIFASLQPMAIIMPISLRRSVTAIISALPMLSEPINSAMTEIAREINGFYPRIALMQLTHDPVRSVTTAIVDRLVSLAEYLGVVPLEIKE